MATTQVRSTRRVDGPDWLVGKEDQDRYWSRLRRDLEEAVAADGRRIIGEPIERIEYDELRGDVILDIRATVTQERGSAPA